MPRGRGGYRKPTDPAPVSGPGGLSKRTDGGPGDKQPLRAIPGGSFGDRQATLDQQRAAPLARASSTPPAAAPAPASPQGAPGAAPVDPMALVRQAAENFTPPNVAPFDRPTDFPAEPVTEGLSTGPGAGPESLGLPAAPTGDPDLQVLARYLPALEMMANQPTASVATRNFIRRLRGAVPPGQGTAI